MLSFLLHPSCSREVLRVLLVVEGILSEPGAPIGSAGQLYRTKPKGAPSIQKSGRTQQKRLKRKKQ